MNVSSLNSRQKEAVTAPLVPTLVLAGAGSGKTRVLAFRIAYVIEQGYVPADRILALTFTNKAAKEMQQRVLALFSQKSSSLMFQAGQDLMTLRLSTFDSGLPVLSTFHSLGVRILRQYGYLLGLPRTFSILDNEDQLKVLKEVFTESGIDESLRPQAVMHFIHTIKNSGALPEAAAANYKGYLGQQFIACYYAYQTALGQQGSVDLDDLISLPVKLMADFPDVRAAYQDRFRYVLVDEYQDTNPIQYQFLRLLAPPAPLFVVGDDAQSIYGFRGSDITNILNFERDFPDARVIVLDQNYRSTQNVLAVAEAILRHSTEQKPKVLWTENAVGQKVLVKQLPTEIEEADFVVRTLVSLATGEDAEQGAEEVDETNDAGRPFSVLEYMLKGRSRTSGIKYTVSSAQLPGRHQPLSQFAVLYRTHAQSRALEEALLAAGVPYKIVGGVRFFDRREVKDAISYLRVLLNVRDSVALSRAAGTPPKGIGDKTLGFIKAAILESYNEGQEAQTVPAELPADGGGVQDNIRLLARVRHKLASLPQSRARTAAVAFFEQLSSWAALSSEFPLHDLLERVITEAGLFKHYGDHTEAGDARVENLRELIAVARKFSAQGWLTGLPGFLEEVALISDLDAAGESDDAVTLMTLHSAKGLEFDVVFFVGLEEGLLPHSRSMLDPKAFAEEVRLAYVGVTRAKQRLYITHVQQRGLFGESRQSVPSRLIRQLPETAVDFRGRQRFIGGAGALSDGGVEYTPFEDE